MNTEIEGRILLDGKDLNEASSEEMQAVRGQDIAMIFQDPLTSLHPFYKIGNQLVEAIQAHKDMSKKDGAGPRGGAAATWWGFPMPAGGSATTRTSSREGCASG